MRLSARVTFRHAQIARITLDGVDISGDCFEADEENGWAACYERNADGHFFTRNGIVAQTTRRGVVVIDFPKGID